MRIGRLVLICALCVNAHAESAESSATRARGVVESEEFNRAVAIFARDFDRYVAEIVTLTEIPAPPFGEKARGEAFLRLLRDAGLRECTIDEEGNVLGVWRGRRRSPLLAVAAHLDTVFPAETDVKVRRQGTRLMAPGVGDDTQGLAFLLALARAMREANIETASDILFVGNVGEEGPGNLRGMRYLFERGPWKDKIERFITVDGRSNDIVVNGALGSVRYRVTFKGPGGHSWAAFGQVNPAFALGDAVARIGRLKVPAQPKVSYNVGVLTGGTSVNSIPHEVSMEVDLRSASAAELKKVDAQVRQIVEDCVDAENAARANTFGKITAEVRLMGERPSGITPPDSALLQQVAATMRLFDKVPVWQTSSTDANIPISLGIPAFAMAARAATRGDRAHSLDEWIDVEKSGSVEDFRLAAAIILAVAELP